jgi:hypothetical protein
MEIEFREGISEVIATTRNDQPNAAPIGIINREFLYTLIYKDSHTFLNVKKNRELVANLVLDRLPLMILILPFFAQMKRRLFSRQRTRGLNLSAQF